MASCVWWVILTFTWFLAAGKCKLTCQHVREFDMLYFSYSIFRFAAKLLPDSHVSLQVFLTSSFQNEDYFIFKRDFKKPDKKTRLKNTVQKKNREVGHLNWLLLCLHIRLQGSSFEPFFFFQNENYSFYFQKRFKKAMVKKTHF